MLKKLAEIQAQKMNIFDVAASEGWLAKVKERYGIKGKALYDDSAGVDSTVFNNWKDDLQKLLRVTTRRHL